MISMSEGAKLKTRTIVWMISNCDSTAYKLLRNGASVEDVIKRFDLKAYKKVIDGNVLLTEGVNFIWRAVRGDSGLTPFNESNSYLGIGNGTAPESASQTGLQGTSKLYKSVDSGYPTISNNRITFRTTFNENEANFAWNEWTVANGNSDSAVNLNRKVESLGTKPQGAIWVLQVTLYIE